MKKKYRKMSNLLGVDCDVRDQAAWEKILTPVVFGNVQRYKL